MPLSGQSCEHWICRLQSCTVPLDSVNKNAHFHWSYVVKLTLTRETRRDLAISVLQQTLHNVTRQLTLSSSNKTCNKQYWMTIQRFRPSEWKHSNTHTHPFNGSFSRTTWVSQHQKGKTNLDFTEARDSERQWHQLGHMQVCTSLQTDNHTSTPPLSFLQAGCPSCRPTNSVKALKA